MIILQFGNLRCIACALNRTSVTGIFM